MLGCVRVKSAVCAPAVLGDTVMVKGTGWFKGNAMVAADEYVFASSPTQFTAKLIGSFGPVVRVNVTVRVPLWPAVQPPRS